MGSAKRYIEEDRLGLSDYGCRVCRVYKHSSSTRTYIIVVLIMLCRIDTCCSMYSDGGKSRYQKLSWLAYVVCAWLLI